MGCTSIHQGEWHQLDGSKCQTIKINPVWYSSETESDCIKNGKSQPVATNHDDISIVAGFAGLLAILLPTKL